MYDFTHCLSDSLEGITHSICTLEFVNNRELYDWVLDALNVYHPQQIEFARLGLTYTVLSKRKLIQLVKGGFGARLGRSPYAHHLRDATPGIHPGSHP